MVSMWPASSDARAARDSQPNCPCVRGRSCSARGIHRPRVVDCRSVRRGCVCLVARRPCVGVSRERRGQGDVAYVEVVAVDVGVLHITACSRGFYVNGSRGASGGGGTGHFDPAPCAAPHFSHALHGTLVSASRAYADGYERLLAVAAARARGAGGSSRCVWRGVCLLALQRLGADGSRYLTSRCPQTRARCLTGPPHRLGTALPSAGRFGRCRGRQPRRQVWRLPLMRSTVRTRTGWRRTW